MQDLTERYVTPYALPEGEVRELLVILAEECAEVIVAVSKALRFGLEDGYPGRATTNARDIAQELGDIQALVWRLQDHGLCDAHFLHSAAHAKLARLKRFMQSPADPAAKG